MAIANQDFQATSNSWNSISNWTSAVPTKDDIVRIFGSPQPLTVGMDQTALLGPLTDLLVAETQTGGIGGSGNALQIDSLSATFKSGAASNWIKGDFPEFFSAPLLQTDNALMLETKVGGTIDNLYCSRGRTTLVDGSDVINVFMLPEANDAILVVQSNTTIIGDLHIMAGQVLLSGIVTGTIYVSGGGILQVLDGASPSLLIQTGGHVKYDGGDFTGGSPTAPTVICSGGFFDATKHGARTVLPNFLAIGNAVVDLRTKTKGVVRTDQKKIGSPLVHVDDGDSF